LPAPRLSLRHRRFGTGAGSSLDPVTTRTASAPIALALILAVQLMVVLDLTVVNVALIDIKLDLGFSTPQLSWVLNAYTLAAGGLLLLGARAGDLLGRRPVLIAGIAVFTLASLAGGLATSAALLLAARAVQGVGAAVAAPQALSLLTTTYTEGRERTRALAWFSAVSVGGLAIGLIIGGALTDLLSWRWVFFINVPVGVAIVVVARRYLTSRPRTRGHFDLTGAITSTAGMTTLVYAFVRTATDGWTDRLTLASFAAGVILLGLFLFVERRAEQPITPLHLFAHRQRSAAYLGRLLLMGGTFGMFFFLTQYMQQVLGLSPLTTGFGFVPLTLALFTASQLAGRDLVERFGARPVLLTGLSLSTLAMIWLSTITAHTGYLALLGPLLLFGIGNGLAFVPLTSLGLAGVVPGQAGAASGLLNAMQQVGGSLGLSVLVTVYGHATASSTAITTGTLVHGTVAVFEVTAAFLAAALIIVVAVTRPRRTAPPAEATSPVPAQHAARPAVSLSLDAG
jgi:EmrB/QacA subfamily drug resistance transporter